MAWRKLNRFHSDTAGNLLEDVGFVFAVWKTFILRSADGLCLRVKQQEKRRDAIQISSESSSRLVRQSPEETAWPTKSQVVKIDLKINDGISLLSPHRHHIPASQREEQRKRTSLD